jgi:preprotein translocase subunit SecY
MELRTDALRQVAESALGAVGEPSRAERYQVVVHVDAEVLADPASFSVVALGLNPFVIASCIMQLMQGVGPSLQALSRGGEYGRARITQDTRYLAVPLAVLQSYGFLALLNANGVLVGTFDLASFETLTQMATLTAGSISLMWIGELITERGIGNGISFVIFAGIVSQAPSAIGAFIASPNIAAFIAFGAVAIAAVAVIIYIQEGQRRIPIQYASRVRGRRMYQGGQTFLPLRVNQAGVIPIIFAVSILLFPVQLASYFTASQITIVADIANAIVSFLNPQSIVYIIMYFLLTVGFTYFYTAFTFKPDETAEQLRKNGGFIPGIRPGRPTQDYLARVVSRITFAGAMFLAIVAVSPSLIGFFFRDLGAIGLGGTSLLIVVSVVVETMKQIEAQLMMRNYEGFIR